jgi:predicted nucleic acid-binding protein
MMVVDASVLIDIIIDPIKFKTDIDKMQTATAVFAPHILDLEVVSGLRKMLRDKRISNPDAESAIGALRSLPIKRVDVSDSTLEIWKLRDNFTAYDAAYVVLAKQLGALLLTHDTRLASHAQRLVPLT